MAAGLETVISFIVVRCVLVGRELICMVYLLGCLLRMAAAGAAALTVISGSGLRCRCLLLSW